MNVLLLAGESSRNQAWIEQVSQALAPLFDKTYAQQYAHWETGGNAIDFAPELAKLEKAAAGFEPYAIFAKSIGTMLAVQGMHDGSLRPTACLFVGLPLGYAARHNIALADWLAASGVSCAIAQNEDDPVGSCTKVQQYFSQAPAQPGHQPTLLCLPGDTHNYNDLETLRDLMAQLVHTA